MAEVPTAKILERYQHLLAARTHDVILRDLAIEQLEAEVKKLQGEVQELSQEARELREENFVE